MPRIATFIVDPSPRDRRALRRLLDALPEMDVAAECGGAGEALKAIESYHPRLAFLSVDLPEIDGFELVERCDPQIRPRVVFLAEGEEHASEAFEVRALDFLVKPIAPGRLRKTVERARRELKRERALVLLSSVKNALEDLRLERELTERFDRETPTVRAEVAGNGTGSQAVETEESEGAAANGRIQVRRGGRIILLDPDDVEWVEAVGCYARLHTRETHYLHRITMKELKARLDSSAYFRIHRSYIVRWDRIREVRRCPDSEHEYVVLLEDGTILPLSRRRRAELLDRMSAST